MRHFGPVGCALFAGALLCAGAASGQAPAKGASASASAAAQGAPATGASAGAQDPAEQARKLYEKGRALATAGKWDAAYAEFRAAYAWLAHWQIAGGLGDAAFALGKYPEAIDMLSQQLAGATNLTPTERAQIEKRIAEAKSKCGTIRLSGEAGAEVKVDGAAVGTLPLGKELYVLPGSHTVEIVGAAGTVKKTVEVTAGKEAGPIDGSAAGGSAKATPGPAATGAPAPTASPTATSTAGAGGGAPEVPSVVPGIVLGVAAGVALLTGVGVFVGSEVKGGEATTAAKKYDNLIAKQQTDAAKKVVGDLLREQDALITGAVAAWIGAAALAGGTGVYFYYRSRVGREKGGQTSAPGTAVQWAPVVSPAGAGVVVQGSF